MSKQTVEALDQGSRLGDPTIGHQLQATGLDSRVHVVEISPPSRLHVILHTVT